MDYDDECDIHLGTSIPHPLLRKPLVGRTKVNATKGIKGDETFGRPSPKGEIGVAGLLHHQEFKDPALIHRERNFRKLNKEAAKMGVTTSRGTYEFRKDHDYKLEKPKKEFKSHNPGMYDPEYTFGISTKPEGYTKTLIEGGFGKEWLEKEVSRDIARSRSLSPKRTYSVVVNPKVGKRGGLGQSTKSPLDEAEEALAEKDRKQATESFKMRQFMDAKPKVSTRRYSPPPRLPRLKKDWETGELVEVDPSEDKVDVFPHLKHAHSQRRCQGAHHHMNQSQGSCEGQCTGKCEGEECYEDCQEKCECDDGCCRH
ncbi:putative protein of unknown function (DUF4483) [Monocercomonoides exilis]|uniref:putative protein of unknown function (DUF4483) n=1 Tax=Monocercomonoides exilis TaxID=2049356 RepID=UPI003559BC22|nr:putative protein of unknown function (DUF4483) [Monocercomonoides exilis]|eukprot:MONOS_2915.1-p1 / transcript=MONOS_2915.1 / gene=MONOS_2915 / organism=Monocercomonoides_exilis_PA203 / gene_product=unspecified product / transcript_product=unspecified product / location=Mono_scaffold00063:140901-142057(+) / protein_length=312 / sequence_SO=supercontig / SO=protein_coding / is_pseudo=false